MPGRITPEGIQSCVLDGLAYTRFSGRISCLVSAASLNKDGFAVFRIENNLTAIDEEPPKWSHLKDVFDFKHFRPNYLTSEDFSGAAVPHHILIRWDRYHNIVVFVKR